MNQPKVVYVVYGYKTKSLNNRVKKLLALRKLYAKMVLVCPANLEDEASTLVVKAWPNPTGILRVLGCTRAKQFADRFLFFPSPKILYVWAVVRRLRKLIRKDLEQGSDVCLITSVPPHDVSLVGLALKKKFPEIRWVVDWRDLWSYDEYYRERIPRLYRSRLIKREKEVLKSADKHVTTNPYAQAVLENRYGVPPERVTFIPHAFCRDGHPNGGNREAREVATDDERTIRIGFLGTLFKPPKVPGTEVIDAIRYVREHGMSVEFHVYGAVPPMATCVIRDSDAEWLKLHGSSTREDVLQKVQYCDLLFLVLADLPSCRAIVHAKLPDYLLLRRPIVALVPERSAVADIIRETKSGYVIPSHLQWRGALLEFFRLWRSTRMQAAPNGAALESYDWETVSKQWSNVIDSCGPVKE